MRGPESDRVCPWCASTDLRLHKKMPNPNGPGILAYIIFPIAGLMWLTTPTYNVCGGCGGRWQRGVAIEPRRADEPHAPPPSEARAGMYAEQVPTAAVVRRRPRLGPENERVVIAADDVELRAPPGSCRVCRQAAGRYDSRDAPKLPVVGCTCEGGCKCELVPADS